MSNYLNPTALETIDNWISTLKGRVEGYHVNQIQDRQNQLDYAMAERNRDIVMLNEWLDVKSQLNK